MPLVLVRYLATRRRASFYIGGVWIRLPKGPHMKRLLLVMGAVGCGPSEKESVAALEHL